MVRREDGARLLTIGCGLAGVASGLLVTGRFRGSTSAGRPPSAAAVRRKRPGLVTGGVPGRAAPVPPAMPAPAVRASHRSPAVSAGSWRGSGVRRAGGVPLKP